MDVAILDTSSGEGEGGDEAGSSSENSGVEEGLERGPPTFMDGTRRGRGGRMGGVSGRRIPWRWPPSRRLEQRQHKKCSIHEDMNGSSQIFSENVGVGTGRGKRGGVAGNRSCSLPLRNREGTAVGVATTEAATGRGKRAGPPLACPQPRTYLKRSASGGSPAEKRHLWTSNTSNDTSGCNGSDVSSPEFVGICGEGITPTVTQATCPFDEDNSYDSMGRVYEPASPTTSSVGSDSDCTSGWAERVGLTSGVPVTTGARPRIAATAARRGSGGGSRGGVSCTASRRRSPLGNELPVTDRNSSLSSTTTQAVMAKNDVNREVPRFLRPVIVLLTLSLVAMGCAMLCQARSGTISVSNRGRRLGRELWGGNNMVLFGPAVYAAGGVQLPEEIVDDIFERADKDNDGVIGDEEIQYLVEGAGGSLLDDASEIKAGVASVIKNLDHNADQALSRSDLNTYWDRLGTLLTVDEAAQWVLHAAQLPQEVADAFVNNMVTGYDFPELAARQGALLEADLGITRPAFKRTLVRSMQWKLWGMGEEPAAPTGLRAANATCSAVSVDWDQTTPTNSELSFPVHKYVLRRAPLGKEGEREGDWVTVMAGPNGAFFDTGLRPGAAYRYALQAWNALGHSSSVMIDVVVATEDCRTLRNSWFWPSAGSGWGGSGIGATITEEVPLGGLIGATLALPLAAYFLRALRGGHGVGGGKKSVPPSSSSSSSFSGGNDEGSDNMSTSSTNTSRRESSRRRPEPLVAVTGTSTAMTTAKRSSSPMAATGGVVRLPSAGEAVSRRQSGGTYPSSAAIGESVRRQQRIRKLTYRHSSRDDKEVCKECRKEWKWYRRGRHTCCQCHEQFCDSKGCGSVSHFFGACPVGGSCICITCLES